MHMTKKKGVGRRRKQTKQKMCYAKIGIVGEGKRGR